MTNPPLVHALVRWCGLPSLGFLILALFSFVEDGGTSLHIPSARAQEPTVTLPGEGGTEPTSTSFPTPSVTPTAEVIVVPSPPLLPSPSPSPTAEAPTPTIVGTATATETGTATGTAETTTSTPGPPLPTRTPESVVTIEVSPTTDVPLPTETPSVTPTPAPPPPIDGEGIVDEEGGVISTSDGSVQITFPEGATDEPLRVTIARTDDDIPPPLLPDGDFVGLWDFQAFAIERGSAPVHEFAEDLEIRVAFSENDLLGYNPMTLRFRYFDEEAEEWTTISGTAYDPETRAMTIPVNHFSEDGAVADKMVNTAPLLDGRSTDLHTGTSRLNHPLAVPAGRGGLTPALNLTYDSGRLGNMRGFNDVSSWVGQGWDLTTGSIQIDWTAEESPIPQGPKARYFLELDGYGGEMVLDGTDGMYNFRLRDEKFIRIRSSCLDGACPWYITDQSGTQYVFGGSDNSKRWYGERGLGSTGYVRRYYKLDLETVTDLFENRIEYSYEQIKYKACDDYLQCPAISPCVPGGCMEYILASYPSEIAYNFDAETPLTRILFTTGWDIDNSTYSGGPRYPKIKVRADTPYYATLAGNNNYPYYPAPVMEVRHLDAVDVVTTDGADEYLARRYNFAYHNAESEPVPAYPLVPDNYGAQFQQYRRSGNLTLASLSMTERSAGPYDPEDPPTDLLYTKTFSYEVEAWGNTTKPYLWPTLSQATNGFGGVVSFDYAESAAGTANRKRLAVVEERHDSGAAQPDLVRSFSYPDGPVFEFVSGSFVGEFKGFPKVYEYDAAGVTGNKTEHYFHTGGSDWALDALGGLEYLTVQRAPCSPGPTCNGAIWHQEQTTWSVRGIGGFGAIRYGYNGQDTKGYAIVSVQRSRTDSYLKDNTHFQQRSFYDQLGHQIRVENLGDVSGTADDITTVTEYASNLDAWLFTPRYEDKIDPATGGLLARTQYYYDGANSADRGGMCPLADPCLTHGLLTARSTRLTTDGDTTNTYFAYDTYGNVVGTSNPTGTTPESSPTHLSPAPPATAFGWLPTGVAHEEIEYDGDYHAYPVERRNTMGHQTDLAYDFVWGKPETITGPHAGNPSATNVPHTNLRYDDFGRLIKAWNDDDSEGDPTREFAYEWGTVPNRTVTEIKTNTSGGERSSVDCADGFGRTVEGRSHYNGTTAGSVSRVLTDYDDRGHLLRTSMPEDGGTGLTCANATDPISTRDHTVYSYDPLGNVKTTTIKNASGTISHQTTSTYDGASSTFCDELQNLSVTTAHYGNGTVDVDEPAAEVADCEIDPEDEYFRTTYSYDRLGRLTQVEDTHNETVDGNLTSMEYDLGGRRTSLDDPDQGFWEYEYDTASNLVEQTDARSVVTTMAYDALQRLTEKSFSGSGVTDATVTYEYDSYPEASFCNEGVTALGRLVRMTDGGGTGGKELHCYDRRGRETKTRRVVDNTDYDFTRTYDHLNQVVGVEYPDDDLVQYVSGNAYGFITGMTSTTSGGSPETLATAGLSTAFGATDKFTLGTSTAMITDYSYDFRLRPTRIQTGTSGSSSARQDLELTFDAASNVTSVTDHNDGNELAEFEYDQLHRLKEMSVNTTVEAEYEYSSIGNLLRKKEGASAADRTLMYPTAGPTSERPHAVTSTVVNGNTELTLTYDANGNVSTQGSETYTYDASNFLKTRTVTGGTMTYTRDGNGGVVKRSNSADSSSTAYMGGLYEKQSNGTITKYYSFYGQTIAKRVVPSGGASTLTYLLHDHLGSTYASLSNSGSLLPHSITKYWPYGSVREGGAITGTDQRFTGQREEPGTDALDLYDYGARFYSTTVGRFLSVDPIAGSAGDPQSWNPYMYVRGNPIANSDPSGMKWDTEIDEDQEAAKKRSSQEKAQETRHYEAAAAEDWVSAPAMQPYEPCVQCLLMIAASLAYQEAAATAAWVASQPVTDNTSHLAAVAEVTQPADDGGVIGSIVGGAAAIGRPAAQAAPRIGLSVLAAPAALALAIGVAATIPESPQTNRPVVIGENMKRVESAAGPLNALIYGGPNRVNEDASDTTPLDEFPAHASELEVNRRWIQNMMREGKVIYDIGIDNSRSWRSEFYAMEVAETAGYPNLVPYPYP